MATRFALLSVLVTGACDAWQGGGKRPQSRYLVERSDAASLVIDPEVVGRRPVAGEIEIGDDGTVWMRKPLGGRGAWKGLGESRSSALGMTDGGPRGWHLEATVPTTHANSVQLEQEGKRTEFWERPGPPRPFSAFYQSGGFIPAGIYLALPRRTDPNELDLFVRFRPTAPVLAERFLAEGVTLPASVFVTPATAGFVTQPALLLPPGARFVYPVSIAPGASLCFGLAVVPSTVPLEVGSTGALRVGFRGRGEAVWQLDERISFAPDAAGWVDHRIGLQELSGKQGELVLELVEPGSSSAFHYVGDLRFDADRRDDRPNLLLIVVDGLRVDRLENGELTPTMRALAESGLSFAAARSTAPWTLPSIASLFTGVPAARHGLEIERNPEALPTDLPTLAEVLREAGYATAAVTANLHLHSTFGLHRGFGSLYARLADARQINETTLGWIDTRGSGPFFAFVFYMDTHHPFRHRPEYDRSSGLGRVLPEWGQMTSREGRRRAGAPDPTSEEVELLRALYDENVRYTDERIGELLGGLEDRGLRENTLVVVTADHGEAFLEHGDLFHGWSLYDELLRVPLILSGPALSASGTRHGSVSLVDLAASLLALLGLPDGGLGGSSDLVRQSVSAKPRRASYAETRFRQANAASIVDGSDKLIWHRHSGRLELYDLVADPGERWNGAAHRLARAEELRAVLETWLDTNEMERRVRRSSAPTATPPSEMTEHLRALGYAP